MADFDKRDQQEIFSKRVRAGKRTYFFDVKTTRSEDFYLTITESKKRFSDDGYEKHKIFLYKEDFESFMETLNETVEFIKEKSPAFDDEGNLDENEHIANKPHVGEEFEDVKKQENKDDTNF
ncbi:MAG: hypothetical protein ACJATA_001065 [Sphingobacteriales bacterium]|jgi:hypothetical protein